MTLKGGTSQACAACKYQRRRCTSECPLAPYFPPDQPKLFQNAHKLFGVSNILKILKKLEPDQKATAMWSIMYQANERDRDPIHGCLGKIFNLRYQMWAAERELMAVQSKLEQCRQQQQQISGPTGHPQGLELVMAPPSDHVTQPVTTVYPEGCYDNVGYDNSCADANNVSNPMWLQFPYGGDNEADVIDGSMAIQQQFMLQQQEQTLDLQQEVVVPDYDEMPFFDIMDDRQSYIDSKDAYDSSSEESVLRDTNQSIEHMVDKELKNAAACLTLTSVKENPEIKGLVVVRERPEKNFRRPIIG